MAWTAIAPLGALASIFLCLLATRDWRDSAIRALTLFGLLVALITEALGALGALERIPVILTWCVVLAGSLALGLVRWRGRRFPAVTRPRASALDFIVIAGIAATIAIVALIAWISPPNSSDAMAYHMPRVVYWAQQHSVSFFPTPYYPQIMLQPLAEYFMLQSFVLSGGDHFINFVQWLGMLGSVICVSSVARLLGAKVRGQVIAALFCATLPNGILQASGAKNDYLLALWLVSMAYFALRYVKESRLEDLVYCGVALALALFTKGTAYLYAPGILVAIFLPAARQLRWGALARMGLVFAGCVLLVNGPQYARNLGLSGSPLGFDSAQGDGLFRWRNETFGWKQTASNVLRNLADQMGGRSAAWNQGVYDNVVRLHRWMHADASDPATTWRWTQYEPPRNANHETNASNRWHLLILVAVSLVVMWRAVKAGQRGRLWYLLGVGAGFVLFCFYLKWQLFLARLFLPLFVLAAPLAGAELERLRPALLQWVLCLFLLNNSRPFLFENWVRPLRGPNNLFVTRREDNYFADMKPWHNRDSFLEAVKLVSEAGCGVVGIDSNEFQLEYPFQALLREVRPSVEFVHTGVKNASLKYDRPTTPCAVLCMDCAGKPERLNLYRGFAKMVQARNFVLFLR